MAPPAAVPESLLKKRKRDEEWANKKAAAAADAQKKARENRRTIFKRAEAYTNQYRRQVLARHACLREQRHACDTLAQRRSADMRLVRCCMAHQTH